MDKSDIIQLYIDFLQKHHVGEDDAMFSSAIMDKAEEVSPELAQILCRVGLTGLDDRQMIEVYESIGAQNYGRGVSLEVKQEEFKVLLDNIGSDQETTSVIDFGCATGLLPVFLKKHSLVKEMAGLDGCRCYIETGKEICRNEEADVEFIYSFADKTPLPNASYDIAYCIDLLDCSRNWRSIVKEMARVARQKVIIIYAVTSLFRSIDPLDVLGELSKTMVVDPPHYFNPTPLHDDGRICGAITATRKRYEEKTSSKLVIARAVA